MQQTSLSTPMPPALNHFVRSGNVHLSVNEWPAPGKPVVVLVHGYPDNSSVWDRVVPLLVPHFHVVTYDVRGAGDSDKPTPIGAYQLTHLCEDFKAVIDAVSPNRPVHAVAHDWGSIQTWESVTEPALKGRMASYTSCSGPCLDHVGHWARERMGQPSRWGSLLMQLLKSWYIYTFHLPFLPRWQWHLGLARAWPTLLRWLEGIQVPAHPGQASDGSYGVQLYRANMLPRLVMPRERYAHAPVQILVPTGDLFVSAALTENLGRWVPDLTRTTYPSGHWMPLSHPGAMADAVRQFVMRQEATLQRLA
jgi:pimeloyl-ACP methyl ester carboxylesterase